MADCDVFLLLLLAGYFVIRLPIILKCQERPKTFDPLWQWMEKWIPSGSYDFVTVAVKKKRLRLIWSMLRRHLLQISSLPRIWRVVVRARILRINQFYMEASQIWPSTRVKDSWKRNQMDFLGVYVMQVADDSTFKGILNIADVLRNRCEWQD